MMDDITKTSIRIAQNAYRGLPDDPDTHKAISALSYEIESSIRDAVKWEQGHWVAQLLQDPQLTAAFMKAENETAEQFNHATCGMIDKDGKNNCPVCFFWGKMKENIAVMRQLP